MNYKTKRLFLVLLALFGLMLSNMACDDDDSNDVPDTGTESFDEAAEDTGDTLENTGNALNDLYCLDSRVQWETRCGGDGIDPNANNDGGE